MIKTSERTRPRTANNATTAGSCVSDELCAVLEPLLPMHVNRHRSGGGRPRKPDRICADGIFYMLRTGCQWNALDATGIRPGSTGHDRFQDWVAAGVFLQLWHAGVERFDELHGVDWAWLSMDGAMAKAPFGGGSLLIRWDKKPAHYLAFLHFACALVAFRSAV